MRQKIAILTVMQADSSKYTILATVVGSALVLIAIVVSNRIETTQSESVTESGTSPDRGIERNIQTSPTEQDWEDDMLIQNQNARLAQGRVSEDEEDTRPRRSREEISQTMTGRFSMSLLEETLLNQSGEATEEDVQAAIESIVDQVIQETRANMYTVDDIALTRNSDEATRDYFNAAADIILSQEAVVETDEMTLFNRMIEQNDDSAQQSLEHIATTYLDIRDAYLELTVPTRHYKAHLNIINVFTALGEGLTDMAAAEDDPLLAYVRMERYPDDADGLHYALLSMGMLVYDNEGLFEPNSDAVYFMTFLPNFTSN